MNEISKAFSCDGITSVTLIIGHLLSQGGRDELSWDLSV